MRNLDWELNAELEGGLEDASGSNAARNADVGEVEETDEDR